MLASIPSQRNVMGGVAEISSTIAEPGVIKKVSPISVIRLCELDRSPSPQAQELESALSQAGIAPSLSMTQPDGMDT